MYVVCFYRGLALVHEVECASRDAAELMALEGFRENLLVSIYAPTGRVLAGWNKRSKL